MIHEIKNGEILSGAILGLNDGMFISSGGTANSTTVNYSGYMYISSGGKANDTTVDSGGRMHISNGGVANRTKVRSGYMYISSGGVANSTTVNSSGYMYISSGGVATELYLKAGGYLGRFSFNEDKYFAKINGVAEISHNVLIADSRMFVSSGGVANYTTVRGSMYISSGGVANYTTVSIGSMYISSGGVANYTTTVYKYGYMHISSGGVANNTTAYGFMHISSGGVANSTTVSRGYMRISSGGVANYTTVNSSGYVYITSGGIHSGTMKLVSGAKVTADEGAVIDFDISERTTADGYIINNLALISGAPSFTVTVGMAQEFGRYSLAGGASDFSGTITVKSSAGKLGTITVNGEGLVYDRTKYTLEQNGGALSIIIGEGDLTPPDAPIVSADITTPTNKAVTVTAKFAADAVKNEYRIGDGDWQSYVNGVVFTDNGTVSFRSFDAAENLSEVVSYTVNNIDKVAPTLSISGNPTDWTNQDVTLTATVSDGTVEFFNGTEWIAGAEHTVSSNGTYTFRVTDLAGNITEKSVSVDKIEKEAPEKPSAVADITAVTNKDVTVTATFSTDSAKKEYSLDGKTWQSYTSGIKFAQNGTVYFRGIDAAGNISAVASYTVGNIDKVAPAKPVAKADITAATNKDVTVTATFSTDSAKKEYSLDNKTWQSYTSGIKFAQNGTVYFRGIDAAGNISAVASYTVGNIGKVAPATPVVSADITTPTNKSVTVTAKFAADAVKNEYKLGNGEWQSYVNGVVFTDNGTVSFRSCDAEGNYTDIVSYTVRNIDKVAPVTPLVSADITTVTNKNVTVRAAFSEDSVVKSYSFDNKNYKSYTSAVVMSSNGTVYFKAADAAGNVSNIVSYTVSNIDKTAPAKPIVKASTTSLTNKTVSVTATFSGDTVSKQYSRDNKTWMAYQSAIVFSSNGTVYFRGIDAAGNAGSTSYTVSNIDKVAPSLTISGNSSSLCRKVTLKAAASDANGIKLTQYSFDNKTWTAGTSVTVTKNGTVYFKTTDNAGNVTTKSTAVTKISTVPPTANLLSNGVSQIVGWDKAKGAVGFMATDGVPGNKWRGVWDWDGKDVDLWRVVGVGHFAGSKVDHDGILLYNGIGTTFAAWTNLNDPSYGYVNLCHVEGNFNTKCLTDLDSDKYDDVLIYDEKGSFGVVLDGATYKDIWHVDNAKTNPWQLCGAGSFGGTADKLVVKNTSGHLYLWTNNDPTFKTWNWSQSVLGYIGNDFEFVDIGDFKGDGKDDILLKKKADGGLWVWDDGNASTAHWVVTPEKGFAVEGVGDYNGDCKDDILVREYNTGWGGLGYYAPGGDTLWNDLNARIETGYESNFAIIA